MPDIDTNADSIAVSVDGHLVRSLRFRGTLSGVIVDYVGGKDGAGTGCLIYSASAGTLAWRAPGSDTFGEGVDVSAGGSFLLEDGEDADQFARVTIEEDYLPASDTSADVVLADRFENGIIAADVTAAQAAAGATLDRTVMITCNNEFQIQNLIVWLEDVGTLWISADGISYTQPTEEENGIELAVTMEPDNAVMLYLRRIIPAASEADPRVIDIIHLSFTAEDETRYHDLRGCYRVFNAAAYRFYRSQAGPPEPGDEPFATAATLPATPDVAWADGSWYVSLSYFNGVIDSSFRPLGPAGETHLRFDLDSGDVLGTPPINLGSCRLEGRAGGVVTIIAHYDEAGDNRAGEWAIAYTTDGNPPAADDPDVTAALPDSGLAVLEYALPAQADATTVKVLLQTRRDDGEPGSPSWVYSEDSTVLSLVVDATGPSSPLAGGQTPDVRRAC